jgi:hypothetical protein
MVNWGYGQKIGGGMGCPAEAGTAQAKSPGLSAVILIFCCGFTALGVSQMLKLIIL